MNNTLNIVLSILLIIFIITFKIIVAKKNSNKYRDELYSKIKKIRIFLLISSVITFIIFFLINHYLDKETNMLFNTINALSISIILLPISSLNLYQELITKEDKLTHITNVVTDIIDEKYTNLFNRAGINLIILAKEKPKFISFSCKEEEYKKSMLSKNIHIKTTSKNILTKIKSDNIIQEFTSLEKLYKRLINARGEHDNYLRLLKYSILTYVPLFLSVVIYKLYGFPFNFSLLLILITKLLTTLVVEFVYKRMPYDIDLDERLPIKSSVLFGTQEIILLLIEVFLIMINLSIPYMFILTNGGLINQANTIFYNIFIFTNILLTISLYSESFLIKNLLKMLKRIPNITYLLICLALVIALNYFYYFQTMNIGLGNNLASLLMAFLAIIVMEFIKIARLTSIKGAKKHESKNHKKHKRS